MKYVIFKRDRSVSFVTHGNDTLAAIAYTASATSALTIVSVR